MIPVSRRRLNAETRTVFTISSIATVSMNASTTSATYVMPLSRPKRFSSRARWSWTDCTPGAPSKRLVMSW